MRLVFGARTLACSAANARPSRGGSTQRGVVRANTTTATELQSEVARLRRSREVTRVCFREVTQAF